MNSASFFAMASPTDLMVPLSFSPMIIMSTISAFVGLLEYAGQKALHFQVPIC